MKHIKTFLLLSWTILQVGLVGLIFSLSKPAPDARDYHLGWVWPEDRSIKVNAALAGPDGIIYASDESTLYAVQPPGKLLWEYATDQKFTKSPLLSLDGHTIYILHKKKITAVGVDGKQKWLYELPIRETLIDPVLVSPSGDLYLATFKHTGNHDREAGHRITPDGIISPFTWPHYFDDVKLGIDRQGKIYTWNPQVEIAVTDPQGGKILSYPEGVDLASKFVIDDAGHFYYVLGNGQIVAYDQAGSLLWLSTAINTKHYLHAALLPLVISSSRSNQKQWLYVGSIEGQIFAFDTADGTMVWSTPPEEDLGKLIDLSIKDSILYAANDDGNLYAYDLNGYPLWTDTAYSVGKPGSIQFTPQGELVLVQNGRLQGFTKDPGMVLIRPTPLPPQLEKETKEKLITLMLRESTEGEYSVVPATSIVSWEEFTQKASLILYYPVDENQYLGYAPSGAPIRVWWYNNEYLVESANPISAIDEFEKTHPDEPSSVLRPIYTFGFITIDPVDQVAEVYFEIYYGPLAARAYKLTIQQNNIGEWVIISTKLLWLS